MKVEMKLFGILIPFFVVMTLVYAWATAGTELVGIVGLALTGALCAFIAFYLWLTARRLDVRPEDRLDGEIAEQAGDFGFFSPHSWWPLWLGLASATLFLGIAVGMVAVHHRRPLRGARHPGVDLRVLPWREGCLTLHPPRVARG